MILEKCYIQIVLAQYCTMRYDVSFLMAFFLELKKWFDEDCEDCKRIYEKVSNLENMMIDLSTKVDHDLLFKDDRIQELESLSNPYSDCGQPICNNLLVWDPDYD